MTLSKVLKFTFLFFIKLALIGGAVLFIFLAYLEMGLPSVDVLRDVHLQEPLRIFTQDGRLIAEYGEIRRIPVSINEVPKPLIDATLATEDRRFYEQSGVDFIGLARAAVVLVTTGRKEQGGSTITMQVAKNFFLSPQKSYLRKVRQILLALKISHELPKDKILELYFNKIFYGQRAYGVAAAAKIYYGESLDQLTLSQMAMLAGLPQAPSRCNPISNPALAKDRRDHVLARMKDLGYIDDAAYQAAINEPIVASYHDFKPSLGAPYIAEMTRQWIIQQYGKKTYEQGYDVYTTIDSRLQIEANKTLAAGLIDYDQRHGYRGPEGRLGNSVIDNVQPWIDQLRKIRIMYGLIPAIVMNVTDQTAGALLPSGQIITIPWEGLSWARWQIRSGNQVFLGATPTTAKTILKVGNLIRVQQLENGSYRLSQIPDVEGALIALNPNNGAILALNGGFDYFTNNFNHASQAQRQPGSGLKPFFYSAALEKGFTLASIINDAPIAIQNIGGNSDWWRPTNDTKKFYGPTNLRDALVYSRNMVSIRLMQAIGISYSIDYMTRFGFDKSQMPTTLSLALGTSNVIPLRMTEAYAVFANGGYRVDPYFIDHVVDDNKNVVYQANPLVVCDPKKVKTAKDPQVCATQAITPQNDYLMTNVMQDVIRRGTGKRALPLNRKDLAGKTGTTNDEKDAWFNGFNRNLVATIWVGYDQPQSLYELAAEAAVPIWVDFMKAALQGVPETEYPLPPGIVTVRIDPKTGLLASSNNPHARFEIFQKQDVPTRTSGANMLPEKTSGGTLNQLY